MNGHEVIGRVDGRDVTVWNTAAAGRPPIERVRASIDEAHAALEEHANRTREDTP